jgi:hypothetical protein
MLFTHLHVLWPDFEEFQHQVHYEHRPLKTATLHRTLHTQSMPRAPLSPLQEAPTPAALVNRQLQRAFHELLTPSRRQDYDAVGSDLPLDNEGPTPQASGTSLASSSLPAGSQQQLLTATLKDELIEASRQAVREELEANRKQQQLQDKEDKETQQAVARPLPEPVSSSLRPTPSLVAPAESHQETDPSLGLSQRWAAHEDEMSARRQAIEAERQRIIEAAHAEADRILRQAQQREQTAEATRLEQEEQGTQRQQRREASALALALGTAEERAAEIIKAAESDARRLREQAQFDSDAAAKEAERKAQTVQQTTQRLAQAELDAARAELQAAKEQARQVVAAAETEAESKRADASRHAQVR